MSRFQWAILMNVLSAAILCLDAETGPYILFPILFVIPVGLSTWFIGQYAGITYAVLLVVSRFVISTQIESGYMPFWAAAVNAAIRLVVLIGLAVLLGKIVRQREQLVHRVEVLEGILPICMHCKKIRIEDGEWESVETYVSKRSTARFSHGLCEDCRNHHYSDIPASKKHG